MKGGRIPVLFVIDSSCLLYRVKAPIGVEEERPAGGLLPQADVKGPLPGGVRLRRRGGMG
jgi:hypothetical protein